MTSSLAPSGLRGVQDPRLVAEPPTVDDYASEAAGFASAYGLTPDPWQERVLRAWLGVREDGKWASSRCGLSVPRQNGKNALIEIRELFGMVGLGEKILHTAHEVKTSRKAFLRLCSFFENSRRYPELARLVAPGGIRRTNGQEAILLSNGGSVEFVARSRGSARGFTVDVVVMDEAQEMSDDALEALSPTTAAAPLKNRQLIWTGTPPAPGMSSQVWSRMREESLKEHTVRSCWHEWSAAPDSDLDAPETWAQANPALGLRVDEEDLAEDRQSFSDEGFARERLGVWSTFSSRGVIPMDAWSDRFDEGSMAVDRLALGIEVGPDLESASVVLAGQRGDGDWHVEIDESRAGAAWVVAYVSQILDANPQLMGVAGDVGGPLKALTEERGGRWFLKGTQIRVRAPRVVELGAACSHLLDGVVTGWLRHTGQPQMSMAVRVAGKRALGDTGMWVFSRKTAVADITSIQAAVLALWWSQNGKQSARVGRSSGGRRAVVLP